jgi:hypothetical protein
VPLATKVPHLRRMGAVRASATRSSAANLSPNALVGQRHIPVGVARPLMVPGDVPTMCSRPSRRPRRWRSGNSCVYGGLVARARLLEEPTTRSSNRVASAVLSRRASKRRITRSARSGRGGDPPVSWAKADRGFSSGVIFPPCPAGEVRSACRASRLGDAQPGARWRQDGPMHEQRGAQVSASGMVWSSQPGCVLPHQY